MRLPALCGVPSAGRHGALEKCPHRFCDFGDARLQREMAGIEEMHLGVGVVALEGLGAGRQEERIVLAPDRQQRRLGAQVALESG